MRGDTSITIFFPALCLFALNTYSTLNMENAPYSLGEVLAVAGTHPFYKEETQYPLDEKSIEELRQKALKVKGAEEKLKLWPILWKKHL